MTGTEWLHSEEAIARSKRPYAHFDWRTDIDQQRAYIADPCKVARHGFYPFIHYEKRTLKFNKKKGKKEKIRDICYAAHIDRCIYQYYSFLLNSLYNERVKLDGFSASAVAYRTDLHENNIHFSKRAFDFIKATAPVYVMIGDFTGFFDNLDHAYLKKQWCSLLGVERLPADHYAVFKNITSYSKFELIDLLCLNGLEDTKAGRKTLNGFARVLTSEQFKANRSLIKKHTDPYGIPQGSPISGLLANVYMLEVDKMIHDAVQELGGMYIRYSDDFMIILPDAPEIDAVKELTQISNILKQAPRLELEPNKTQYFHYANSTLINCGKAFHDDADDSSQTINFLGFSFDGHKIKIRAKTVSKYYYRMYRKAKNTVRMRRKTPHGRITGKNLYMSYSRKGAKAGHGNFLTYVDRAVAVYGHNEAIRQDTRRHMQKIRRALNSTW
ncbi:MAG: reverse transcriptase/maturase family protein [Oscillospiraceae bacterium]